MGAFFSFIFFFILVILFIGLILVLTVFNKVRDAFRQMPDSLLPTLTQNNRS